MSIELTKTDSWKKKIAKSMQNGDPVPRITKIAFGNGAILSTPIKTTGKIQINSDEIRNIASLNGIRAGQNVSGAGIPVGTKVREVIDNTTIQLTTPCTSAGENVSLSFSGIKQEDLTAQQLNNQIFVKEKVVTTQEDEFSCTYIGVLEEGDLVGKEINEVGFLDSDGHLALVYHFGPNVKDAGQEYEVRCKVTE